jgi:hypothetical protein
MAGRRLDLVYTTAKGDSQNQWGESIGGTELGATSLSNNGFPWEVKVIKKLKRVV